MRRTVKRRRRIASPVLAGLLLLGVAAAAVPGLTRVPIREVKIHGALQQLTQEDIEEQVRNYSRWGWIRLPVERLRQQLEALNWVSSAKVSREWPLNLSIEISERRPMARWGEDALLDQNAEVFDPGGPINRTLPLLSGPEGTQQEMLDRYRDFSALLGARSLALEELSRDRRGSWSVNLRDGPQLRLGAMFVDGRLERALLALDKLPGKQSLEMAYVDLRYPNGFAVGWRSPEEASRMRGGVSP